MAMIDQNLGTVAAFAATLRGTRGYQRASRLQSLGSASSGAGPQISGWPTRPG